MRFGPEPLPRYVAPLDSLKTCSACQTTYTIRDGFYRDRGSHDSYRARCKPCIRAYMRSRFQEKHETILPQKRAEAKRNWRQRRNRQLQQLYGITLAQYEAMADAQGNLCAICGGEQVAFFKWLAVDHCHDTGKVRGLLCNKCNKGIGLLKHDQEILIAAMRYLATVR